MDAYQRYAPALLRKAQRVLQSSDDAQDIVQTLFIDLLEHPGANLDLPYLYRAVTNRCLTLLRDRQNRARLLSVHEPALRGPIRTRCDDRVIGLDLLARLLERLDEPHAETLVLRFFDDLSLEEVADVLNVSRKTVGNRLARIRIEVANLTTASTGAAS